MKWAIYIGSGVCGIIAGYIPVLLWNDDPFGVSSLLWGSVGTIAGIWVGYKVAKYIGL